MYNKREFNSTRISEVLLGLKGTVSLPKDPKDADINKVVEAIQNKFVLAIDGLPYYIFTRALKSDENTGIVESATFTVRPKSVSKLEVSACKKVITLLVDEQMPDKFIDEMIAWFEEYDYCAKLEENLKALNKEVELVIKGNDIPFTLKFTQGDGIIDATNTSALIGLSTEVIENLATSPLFDESIELRRDNYRELILNALTECVRPYDIIRAKSVFAKDLEIYTRKSLVKLLRNFVNRKLEFVATGTGYVNTDKYFAVVDKVAVTPEELAEMDVTDKLVTDNPKEDKAGKSKIVTSYRISPFDKETEEVLDIPLSDLGIQ